jgi:uncharacterized membrane protein
VGCSVAGVAALGGGVANGGLFQALIDSVLSKIARLHIAAKVATIDFRNLALAVYRAALQFLGYRFAELVSQDKGACTG